MQQRPEQHQSAQKQKDKHAVLMHLQKAENVGTARVREDRCISVLEDAEVREKTDKGEKEKWIAIQAAHSKAII
jgi:hypothetical protein